MKKRPFNRGPVGRWRDTGDKSDKSVYYNPKEFRRSNSNSGGAPRWTRKSDDMEGLMIKIIAAVVLVAVVMWVSTQYKAKQRLQAAAYAAQVQEQNRIVQQQELARQAQLAQLAQNQSGAVSGGRQLYRCVDQFGAISIQSDACSPMSAASRGQSIPAQAQAQTSLQYQEQVRLQGEARLRQEEARFAALTGTGNRSAVVYQSYPSDHEQRKARCQAQKKYRDDVIRQVGLNLTFDLSRKLEEQVYEACKGL